ncbi:MAG: Uncharacterised protein [Porticoccaceae bacterium UBA1117]|nr:MAG: Uncharacterised protein [Porticoccaceae bacterium UBA1117]
MHEVIGFLQRFCIAVKGVRILHTKLTRAHYPKTRPPFIAKFSLYLIEVGWKLFVATNFTTNNVGNDFFMGGA